MVEHPGYRYRPRRKPKAIFRRDAGAYLRYSLPNIANGVAEATSVQTVSPHIALAQQQIVNLTQAPPALASTLTTLPCMLPKGLISTAVLPSSVYSNIHTAGIVASGGQSILPTIVNLPAAADSLNGERSSRTSSSSSPDNVIIEVRSRSASPDHEGQSSGEEEEQLRRERRISSTGSINDITHATKPQSPNVSSPTAISTSVIRAVDNSTVKSISTPSVPSYYGVTPSGSAINLMSTPHIPVMTSELGTALRSVRSISMPELHLAHKLHLPATSQAPTSAATIVQTPNPACQCVVCQVQRGQLVHVPANLMPKLVVLNSPSTTISSVSTE